MSYGLFVLSVLGACTLTMVLMSESSLGADLDLLYPERAAALDEAQDQPMTREEILEKLVSAFRSLPQNSGAASEYEYGGLGLNKRQIRYHQCYFNPISCFRRRK